MASRSPRVDQLNENNSKRTHREREEKEKRLPADAQTISDSDYFLKNSEFRKWLKEEKDRYFDELSGEKARSYFAKFVKAWNRGKLAKSYYTGNNSSLAPAEQTAYRWSFAAKRTAGEKASLDATRNAVGAATRSLGPGDDAKMQKEPTGPASEKVQRGSKRVVGPTMPPAGDRVLMQEALVEDHAAERSYERKRARQEDKERIEDMVGPKERGKEGLLENKRARREADRSFRDAKDDTFGNYDESTLMGSGDTFQARIAQRDAARRRYEEKRSAVSGDKQATIRERQESIRAKDNATMDMFKQMAKERFGG